MATPAPTAEPIDAPSDALANLPPHSAEESNLVEFPDGVSPEWIFRFASPERTETWRFRHHDGAGVLVVKSADRSTVYKGTAIAEGANLELSLKTANAKMELACKPAKLRATSSKCNDTKGPQLDVLECFHADFETPMTFGEAPGIEYVTSPDCTGYRVIAAP